MKEKMFEKIKIQLSVGNKKRNGGFTLQANAKARVRRLEMDKVWNSCLIFKGLLTTLLNDIGLLYHSSGGNFDEWKNYEQK